MFDLISTPPRLDKAPTAEELWAKLESKSETMAADLLNGNTSAFSEPPTRKPRWVALLARFMAPRAGAAFVFYWLH
jgi:hypothetical protein